MTEHAPTDHDSSASQDEPSALDRLRLTPHETLHDVWATPDDRWHIYRDEETFHQDFFEPGFLVYEADLEGDEANARNSRGQAIPPWSPAVARTLQEAAEVLEDWILTQHTTHELATPDASSHSFGG